VYEMPVTHRLPRVTWSVIRSADTVAPARGRMSLGQRFLSVAARRLSVVLEGMNAQSCSNAATAASEAALARRERDESDEFVGSRAYDAFAGGTNPRPGKAVRPIR
jgi:hypothetical protein